MQNVRTFAFGKKLFIIHKLQNNEENDDDGSSSIDCHSFHCL